MTFPSVAATYTYMFTSGYYFFSVFLTVLAVYFVAQEATKKWRVILGIIGSGLIAASLGIYQGYLGIACCLMAVYLFLQVLFAKNEQKETIKLLKNALRMLVVLIAGFILYYVINIVILHIFGIQMGQGHVSSNLTTISLKELSHNVVLCYRAYHQILKGDFYGISNIMVFRFVFGICLIIMLAISGIGIIRKLKEKNWLQVLLILVIVAVFPLGINCVLLLTSGEGLHTLMTYTVVIMFLTPIFLWNAICTNIQKSKQLSWRFGAAIICTLLFLVVGSNILQANKAYRKLELANQHAISYLTTLITQIKSLEGYQEDMPILFMGSVLDRQDSTFSGFEQGWDDLTNIMGVYDAHLMTNAAFIEYFCGFQYESPENIQELENSDIVKQMPCYPDYGSVLIYNNVVIVKLSEK
ncbi:MAG: glucosyltransferase domain-containing protein [Clostridiales bacterium]|nr:glucosyltransferase domain-containing protein [Clostridiales bacterium]